MNFDLNKKKPGPIPTVTDIHKPLNNFFCDCNEKKQELNINKFELHVRRGDESIFGVKYYLY